MVFISRCLRNRVVAFEFRPEVPMLISAQDADVYWIVVQGPELPNLVV